MERSYQPASIGIRQPGKTTTTSTTRSNGRRLMDHVLAGEVQAIPYSIRLFCYITITAGFMYSLMYLVKNHPASILYAENGILEWVQICLLLLCTVVLVISSRYLTDLRQSVHILSILPLIAGVREMDKILDNHVFDGAWQLITSAILLYAGYYAWLHRHNIKHSMRRILATPPAGLLLAGFIAVMVFSRILGQQLFWQFALQENHHKLIARIVEESCEIFGYLLLLFGCVEILHFAMSCKKNKRHKYPD